MVWIFQRWLNRGKQNHHPGDPAEDPLVQPPPPMSSPPLADSRGVLLIAHRSVLKLTEELKSLLKTNNFHVELVIPDDFNDQDHVLAPHATLLRETHGVVICLHPDFVRVPYSAKLIEYIAQNQQQLEHKTCCLRFAEKDFNCLSPSKLFENVLDKYYGSTDFLRCLDTKTYLCDKEGIERIVETVKKLPVPLVPDMYPGLYPSLDPSLVEELHVSGLTEIDSLLGSIITVQPQLYARQPMEYPCSLSESSVELMISLPHRLPSENVDSTRCDCPQCRKRAGHPFAPRAAEEADYNVGVNLVHDRLHANRDYVDFTRMDNLKAIC